MLADMEFLGFGLRRRSGDRGSLDAVRDATFGGRLPVARGAGADEEPAYESHWTATPASEKGVPRWRRQSLRAARRGAPTVAPKDEHLHFDARAEAEVEGLERRIVRYRLVSLLDTPDEVRGSEIAVLDEGDEVAVLERRGTYCHVTIPDGNDGWLHRMTLAPMPVAEPPPAAVEDEAAAADDDVAPVSEMAVADGLAPVSFEEILRAALEERQPGLD